MLGAVAKKSYFDGPQILTQSLRRLQYEINGDSIKSVTNLNFLCSQSNFAKNGRNS